MASHVLASGKRSARRWFTPEEDAKIVEIVTRFPQLDWMDIASHLPGRTARQCRERWSEYLNPAIRVEPWTENEDNLLLRQIEMHGHRWTIIAQAFARRSDNDIKNRFYSHLKDSLVISPDGHFELMRDAEGNRVHGKLKRRRYHVPASQLAFFTVERMMTASTDTAEKPVLPQLCSPNLQRLSVGSATKEQ
jgi:hypothetical protein